MNLDQINVVDVLKDVPGVISAFVIKLKDHEVVVVDPGPSNGYKNLKRFLDDKNLIAKHIIVTHVHIDHAGASGLLAKDYPVENVYVHPRGAKHLEDPSKLWEASKSVLGPVAEFYGKPVPVPKDRIVSVSDYEKIKIENSTFLFLHTPGHASHHMSIYLMPEGILFSGDSAGVVLDVEGIPTQAPTTPPIFKPKLYIESLRKMADLEPQPRYLAPTHFGLRADFKKLINNHEIQIRTWLDIALKAFLDGIEDINEITKKIAEADKNAERFLSKSNDYVKRAFLLNSIIGIVDAVKRGEWP